MCVNCCACFSRLNVLQQLRHREYSYLSNNRLNLHISRTLVCQTGSEYECIWRKRSNSPIAYEDGLLYFDNYRLCYNTQGAGRLPSEIYRLPQCPVSQKILDGLVCQCPLEEMPTEHRGWRASFLALTAHNWLVRYDLKTGEILQQIYLSKFYKFKHISWDMEQSRLIVKSTHIHNPMVVNQSLLLAMAIFTVFPLEFVGMLEISRSIFGTSLVDAMICQGALITMHHGGHVRIHSLNDVLTMGKLFSAPLHQLCDQVQGVVGVHPDGVPLNIKLTEAPPVLFDVKCADHNLTLGGIPWHYLISTCGTRGCFKLYNLQTRQMAEGGCMDMDTLSVEPDKCIFHADDSGRILHIGPEEIRVLKIEEISSTGSYKVVPQFKVHASDLTRCVNPVVRDEEVRITSSGRTVRKAPTYDDTISGGLQEAIVGLDYENDLDLLVVTSTFQDDDFMRGTVHLLDNDFGHVLRDIPMDEPWKEFCEHVVVPDIDRIIHIVKAPARKFDCSIYQLNRAPQETSPKTDSAKTHIKSRRSSRR